MSSKVPGNVEKDIEGNVGRDSMAAGGNITQNVFNIYALGGLVTEDEAAETIARIQEKLAETSSPTHLVVEDIAYEELAKVVGEARANQLREDVESIENIISLTLRRHLDYEWQGGELLPPFRDMLWDLLVQTGIHFYINKLASYVSSDELGMPLRNLSAAIGRVLYDEIASEESSDEAWGEFESATLFVNCQPAREPDRYVVKTVLRIRWDDGWCEECVLEKNESWLRIQGLGRGWEHERTRTSNVIVTRGLFADFIVGLVADLFELKAKLRHELISSQKLMDKLASLFDISPYPEDDEETPF